MAFMEPDIYHGEYYILESSTHGTTFLPLYVEPGAKTNADLAMYCEGPIDSPEEPVNIASGILARMSAPGYLDCTEWSPYASEDEALADLRENYGLEDEDDEADEDEADEDDEPQPEDIVTSDYRTFYSHEGTGRPIFTVTCLDEDKRYRLDVPLVRLMQGTRPGYTCERASLEACIREYCDRERFFPSVWFISDHGNAHRMSL